MTDFVDDLERELLAAARRRTAGIRHRRSFARGRLWRGGALIVGMAAAVALIALVVRPAPDPETPATPSTGHLPAAALPTQCRGTMMVTSTPTPDSVLDALTVLRRQPRTRDALPVGTLGWLPVGSYAPDGARRVGDVLVVPTADVRERSSRCGDSSTRGPGACLVSEQPVSGRCFTLDEILAGRAFELDGNWLTGLVPDSWGQVEFGVRGTRTRLPASENLVRDEFGGLRPGDAFTVTPIAALPKVLVINETKIEGLAAMVGDELRAETNATVEVDRSTTTTRRRTEVDSVRRTTLALRIARALGTGYLIHDTEPADPDAPDVIVRVGSDRMR